jgi:hypothetical protein
MNEYPFDCILKRVEFYFNPANDCIYGFTPEQLELNKKYIGGQEPIEDDLLIDTIIWNAKDVFIEGRLRQTVRRGDIGEEDQDRN